MPSTLATAPEIQDYAVVGDCRAAALISRYGLVDWLCWPRFDSSAIFAALLDHEKGGHWLIAPTLPCRFERRYLEHTNVLETRFLCRSGQAALIDLMPVASEKFKRSAMVADHELVRQLVCTEGEIEIQVEFQPRAEYGRDPVRLRDHGQLGLRLSLVEAFTGSAVTGSCRSTQTEHAPPWSSNAVRRRLSQMTEQTKAA